MTYLTTVLQTFFTDYVHAQRNLSVNTIASYRDAWRLLIKHICATTATPADHIRLEDIDRSVVTGFSGTSGHRAGKQRRDTQWAAYRDLCCVHTCPARSSRTR